jgi:hypothetical protein
MPNGKDAKMDTQKGENTMSNKTSIEKELANYKKQKVNMLGPSINLEELSQFHKIVFDSVTLSTEADVGDAYRYKDAYKGKPAQYIITGAGLQKLAVVAGVRWNPVETKITSISHRYVAYAAVGCIRRIDGTSACYKAESDIDIDVVTDEIEESFKVKRKKWAEDKWFQKMGPEGQNDYVEAAKKKECNFRKKHKTKIAATDARSRVLRPLLMLKKTYTAEELKQPFVMARVILSPDYSDPTVRKMMLAAAIQAQTNVFGSTPPKIVNEAPIDLLPEDFHEVPPDAEDPPPPDDDQTTKEEEKPESPTAEEVFRDLSAKEQVETLTQMAKAKGYAPKQPIKNLGPKDRLSFFIALEQMPDVEKVKEEDVPY